MPAENKNYPAKYETNAAYRAGKPILASFVGQTDSRGKLIEGKYFVPYYPFTIYKKVK